MSRPQLPAAYVAFTAMALLTPAPAVTRAAKPMRLFGETVKDRYKRKMAKRGSMKKSGVPRHKRKRR